MNINTDAQWMARAIQLAELALFTTGVNPRVGCVLVKEGVCIGEGQHWVPGEGHAEVNALASLNDGVSAEGATAYVTLEPCSFKGKTGPCANALVKAGVAKVVMAMVDPNPKVSGKGVGILEAAGIEVVSGVLEGEARKLNPGFIRRMQTGLPFVRGKMAMSVDGRTAMASGESQWITGPEAREDVQLLRAQSDAIVTGIETVIADDAALTVRPETWVHNEYPKALGQVLAVRQPLRVVLDSQLRIPLNMKVLSGSSTLIVCTEAGASQQADKIAALSEMSHVEVLVLGEDERDRVDLSALLVCLAERGCNEVLVEAGSQLLTAFSQAALLDVCILYMAPTLLGARARPLFDLPIDTMAEQQRVEVTGIRSIGADIRMQLEFCKND